jgi:hypothetical protein
MQDVDAAEPGRSRAIRAAFAVGEWLMLATGVMFLLSPYLPRDGILSAMPPSSVVSVTPSIALSVTFALALRWLRGAPVSLFTVVLWIVTAWSAIVFEAFR